MSAADKRTSWFEAQALAYGTQDQRDRWADGVLPKAELDAVARGVLFAPLDKCERWRKIDAGEVRHYTHLNLGCDKASVEFWTKDDPDVEMDSKQYRRYSLIKRALVIVNAHEWLKTEPGDAEMTTIEHTAHCMTCKQQLTRLSVSVRVPWAGRTLVREYAL